MSQMRAEGEVIIGTGRSVSNIDELNSSLGRLDKTGSQGFVDTDKAVKGLAGNLNDVAPAFLGVGAAMGGAFVVGIKNAAALEQTLANIEATLGNSATPEVMKQIADEARNIGINSQYSATEVGTVMEGLLKAGMDVTEVLGPKGAAGAVVNLSQATGASLDTAMVGITSTMATFSEEIVGVENAMTDATRVADIYTVAANESAASVDDIIMGMRPLGPVSAMMGVSFEESAAAIALFTNNGMKGADAGISLARGMQNLADPTSEASAKMQELGIRTFDAQGKFIGFPALFEQLNTKMAGLTDQQKLQALATIFGAEAMDVMGLAVLQGSGPLEDLIGLMDQEGIAATQAAKRMDTFQGAMQRLTEGIGTMLGAVMEPLLPILAGVADGLANLAEMVANLPAPFRLAIAVVLGLGGALLVAVGTAFLFAPQILAAANAMREFQKYGGLVNSLKLMISHMRGATTATTAQTVAAQAGTVANRTLGTAIKGVMRSALPLIAVAVAVGLAIKAWQHNFLGVRDAVGWVIDVFRDFGSYLRAVLVDGDQLNDWLSRLPGFLQPIAKAIGNILAPIGAFIGAFKLLGDTVSEETSIAEEDIADFAEATHVVDGVTVYTAFKTNADGEREKVGEIIDSYKNADGMTAQVLIKGDDGEYWATIDLATGEISNAEITVTADATDYYSTSERITNGLEAMKASLNAMGIGAFDPIINGAIRVVDVISTISGYVNELTGYWQKLRTSTGPNDQAMNVWQALGAILRRLALDFPSLAGAIGVVQAALSGIGAIVQWVGNAFGAVLAPVFELIGNVVRRMIGPLLALGAAWLTWHAALFLLGPVIALVGAALSALVGALGLLLSPVVLVIAALVALRIAYERNFLGFGDAARKVGRQLKAWGKVAARAFDRVAELAGRFFDGFQKGMEFFGKTNPVSAFLLAIGSAFEAVGLDAVADVFQTIAKVVMDLVTVFRQFRSQGLDPVAAAAATLRSVFPALTGVINQLEAAARNLISYWQNMIAAFQAFARGDWSEGFSRIKDAAIDLLNSIANLGVALGEAFLAAFRAIDWGAIGSALMSGASAIWDWITDSIGNIDWGAVGSALLAGLTAAFEAVGEWLSNLGGWIRDRLPGAWDWLREHGGRLIRSLRSGMARAWESVTGWIAEHLSANAITAFFRGAWNWLKPYGERLIRSLRTGFAAAWDAVTGWLSEHVSANGITSFFRGAWDWLKPYGARLIRSLRRGFGEAWGEVTAWIADHLSANAITSLLKGSWDWLKEKGAALIDSLRAGMEEKVDEALEPVRGLIADLKREWNEFARAMNALNPFGDPLGTFPDSLDEATSSANALTDAVKSLGTSMGSLDAPPQPGAIGNAGPPPPVMAEPVPEGGRSQMVRTIQEQIAAMKALKAVAEGTNAPLTQVNQTQSALATSARQTALVTATLSGAFKAVPPPVKTSEEALARTQRTLDFLRDAQELGIPTAYDHADAIQNGVGPNRDLNSAMQGLAGTAWSTGPALTAFGSAVGTAFSTVGGTARTEMQNASDAVSSGSSGWGVAVAGAQLGLSLAALTTFGAVNSAAGTALEPLGDTIEDALSEGLDAGLKAVVGFAGDTIGALGVWSTGVGRSLTDAMKTFKSQLSTGTSDGKRSITNFSSDTRSAMSTWKSAVESAARTAMTSVKNHISTNMRSGTSSVRTEAGNMKTALSGRLNEMVSSAKTAGSQVASALRSAMANATSEVRNGSSSWASTIRNRGGDLYNAGNSAGRQAARGLADGIEAEAYRVENAASRIANAAASAMRNALTVRSPSRVTREIGQMVVLGFIDGLTDSALVRQLVGAAGGIADRVGDALKPNVAGIAGVYGDAARQIGRQIGVIGGATISAGGGFGIPGFAGGRGGGLSPEQGQFLQTMSGIAEAMRLLQREYTAPNVPNTATAIGGGTMTVNMTNTFVLPAGQNAPQQTVNQIVALLESFATQRQATSRMGSW